MKLTAVAILCMSGFFASLPANAGIITYVVHLTGTEEVPSNASPATGQATVTVDDIANSVFVDLSFTGLSGPASAAHIHCCVPAGANAAVVIPFTGFPAATSGTYSNTFFTSAANIAGINSYLAYINIHDANFPGGEIRAQITPEPVSFGLTALGIALVALGVRREIGK